MKVVQCTLKCENVSITTFVDKVFKKQTIKQGMKVSLEGDDRVWTIEKLYPDSEIDHKDLHRGWNNNI